MNELQPWKDHDATANTDEWHEILATDGRVIATLDQDPHGDEFDAWTPEEVRAHARLSAAAPDLLAVCESLTLWADRECMPVGGKHDGPWNQLDAALSIAKASRDS